jgi:lipopolysaccharide export system protein LptA
MVGRVTAALALLLAFADPSLAQDGHTANRITAILYPAQGAAQGSKAAPLPGDVLGAFKTDPEAPIRIEADKLDEVSDGAKQAVFSGNVKLQWGGFLLRTLTLRAFYLGPAGFSDGSEWRSEQLIRVEASQRALVRSNDGRTTAIGDWATFDIKANAVLMGDRVAVTRGKDVAQGPRLKIDLTTGLYRFEIGSVPQLLQPPPAQLQPQ